MDPVELSQPELLFWFVSARQIILYSQCGFTGRELCERAAACFALDVRSDLEVSSCSDMLHTYSIACSVSVKLTPMASPCRLCP